MTRRRSPDVPKYEDIKAWLEVLVRVFFPNGVPEAVKLISRYSLGLGAFLVVLWGLLFVTSQIKQLFITNFWPLFYNEAKRQRVRRRRWFAENHLLFQLSALNRAEEWQDFRFAELEAEVEAEGRRASLNWIPWVR